MSKHTKGPWEATKKKTYQNSSYYSIDQLGETGEYVASVDAIAGNNEANARLIAAAPEQHEASRVLAVLVLQTELYQDNPDIRQAVDSVLDIYNRAEGFQVEVKYFKALEFLSELSEGGR